MQHISILGSTGSVGRSTLEVLALHPDRYQVTTLTGNVDVNRMFEQCAAFSPRTVVMANLDAAEKLHKKLQSAGLTEISVQGGPDAISRIAARQDSDMVMSAIVGAAGLEPTLAAVQAGKRVLIANKEPLVMTGEMFMQAAVEHNAVILPIDSEHNAVYQCLPADRSIRHVNKIHLTASGGPFRGKPWASLRDITPQQACAHPNWSMGRKISVDSATMMNKGLELIEATALFGIAESEVEILVHRQSIIHSLVEYSDGSFLAQLGAPDMKIPIAHALAWPDRHTSGAATLDLADIARLDFERPDMSNLPCLQLARDAAKAGGAAPAVLNAANEVAVDAFLDHKIRFTEIPLVIESTMQNISLGPISSIDDVLKIDNEARRLSKQKLDSMSG